MSELNPAYTEWLSLARYQALVAQEQASEPSPLNALAINTIQDAVESMLNLVAQAKGAHIAKRADFLGLFDGVMDALERPDELVAFRPSLVALNTSRVNFKHHGNAPAASTVHRHVERGAEFTNLLCQVGLGQSLDAVSLLIFVTNETARQQLSFAEDAARSGDLATASEHLRRSFDQVILDYTQRKVWYPGTTIYTTKPTFFPGHRDLRDQGLEKVVDWLANIDRWVRYLALGLDMRKYAYFDAHTPNVTVMSDGVLHPHHREGVTYSTDSFARCFNFVLETALAFARDDYDFDAWAAQQQSREAKSQ